MIRLGASLATVTLCLAACGSRQVATAPPTRPDHYIYFGRDRERIDEPAFLQNQGVVGAQLRFTWPELEPERGAYRFEELEHDLEFLDAHGKRLFVQIQDVSFDNDIINVPKYLLTDSIYGGGIAQQYEFEGDDESSAVASGWVARRWDDAVRGRFVQLLNALGREFDGRVQGINLPETAIEFGWTGRLHPTGFTYDGYVRAVVATMSAARKAFPRSEVIQYANFMPGERLPSNDHGYLKRIYAAADSLGVGVGGPDLMPFREGQRNHSYPLIAARAPQTVAGVAVQWGNLDDVDRDTGEQATVPMLVRYATDTLHLDHIFWGTQEPYYSRDVLPYLRRMVSASGSRRSARGSAN